MMVSIAKMTYCAFYYSDGCSKDNKASIEPLKLIDIFGFVFYYPTLITGPVFDYKIYLDYI